MRKTFDYWFQSTANGFIDIEDTGNVCLRAIGGDIFNYGEYYLIIRTNDVGITKSLTYGPAQDEKYDSPLNSCCCSFKRLEYDGYKVNNIIKDFVKNTRAISVEEVRFEDIKDNIKNLLDYIV